MTKDPNDSSLRLPASLSSIQLPLLAGGGIAVVCGMIAGLMSENGISQSLHSYMTALVTCMTISVGALYFVALQHLCRAGWSASVRRIAEIMLAALPVLALLFLPILVYVVLLDGGSLYPWNEPDWADEMDSHAAKAHVLNRWFYAALTIVVLGLFTGVSRFFWSNSREQDQSGDMKLTAKMQKWSGPAVVVTSLSLSAAAFFWIMALDPMWFSTMFAVYLFAGSMLSFFAMMSVMIFNLQRRGVLLDEVNEEHFHDLGKYTFGFIVFWAYIAYSQYMLIWYGNIPEETIWLMHRQGEGMHGWSWISVALVALHWLVPFLATMSRHVRRMPKWMACWGVYILVMHYVDIYWVIMPEAGNENYLVFGGVMGLVCSLLCAVGMFALYLGVVLRIASDVPLIPARDPRLPQALAFENI